MKVLILGAKGNLGGELVKVFQKNNEVIGWDKGDIDITDKDLIFKKIKDIKPEVIINATGYNAVDKCEDPSAGSLQEGGQAGQGEEEFAKAKKLNGDAVGYLADGAIEVEAVLVHYSSDYVFAGDSQEGYKEDGKPEPINKYARTKLMGEQEIISRSGQGLKYYLIRTSKLFGPKGESELAKPSFFDLMLKLSQERDSLDVVDDEVSCFTYTPDLAEATKKLIEAEIGFGIYHITNSGPCTWYEAALELFKQANIDIKVNSVTADKFPRPAKRPKYSVLVNTKLEPMRDWRKALSEYLRVRI